LIVDDDREITRAIGLRLSKAGFLPIMAFDGQQGLMIAQSDPPDAIILDLHMPVMDGFAMLEQAAELRAYAQHPGDHPVSGRHREGASQGAARRRHFLYREALQGAGPL
jgi:CheY-like chemotaxis protein